MQASAAGRFIRRISFLPAIAAVLAAGCTANLDKNPAIIKQAKQVQQMDESIKAMDRRLSTVSADLQETSRDIAGMKATQGAMSPEAVTALEQRITNLEAALQTSNRTVAAMAQSMKENAQASVSARANKADTEKISEDVQEARSSGSSKKVHARGVASTRSSSRKAESSRTRGSYYLVKSGETLENIAASNKTSVKMISDANRLPNGARVLAGQRLYVPGN